jgi:DHA2 family multidrug resistance protein
MHSPVSREIESRTERRSFNPWLIAGTVMVSTFMELLDSSIANVSLPHISRSLSAGVDQSTWILSSYLVSNAIVLPLTGWFSRLIGRKRFFISCTVIFTLSSLLCGLAPSLPLLVFFRVLQGAGGGGLQPVSQAILVDTFPRKKHGMAMAVFAMGALVAPTIGPTIGGWITDTYTWRWIFLINIPIGIISVILTSLVIFDPPHAARKPGSASQIDYIGLGLLTVGLGFAQVVLDKGQRDNWFSSQFILWATIVALAALLGMVIWEFRVVNPIVELHLLLERNFVVSTSLMFMLGFMMYGTIVLLPILLQTVMGYTAEQSGLVLLPGGIATLIALPVVGRLLTRVEPRRLIALGLVLFAIGLLQLSDLTYGASMRTPTIDWVVSRLGTAFLFVPVNVMAFSFVPRDKTNQATGLISLSRNIGGSMGISFVTTMLYRRASYHLDMLGVKAATIGRAPTQMGLAPDTAHANHPAQVFLYQGLQRQAMMMSFIDNFRIIAMVALGVIALLLLMKKTRPNLARTD